jgi:hypothetical protein
MVARESVEKSPMSVPHARPNRREVELSNKKRNGASLFDHVSVVVSDGTEYGLEQMLQPLVTLSHARAIWKGPSLSLTATIIDERDHS